MTNLIKLTDQELIDYITENYDFGAPESIGAIVRFLEYDNVEKEDLNQFLLNQLDKIEENGNYKYFNIDEKDYIVGNDSEMEKAQDDYLENYIDDCVLYQIPEHLRHYFDDESFKEDLKMDGRGHHLASCDGNEQTVDFNDVTYYFYRTN
jgi:hypothetical protein